MVGPLALSAKPTCDKCPSRATILLPAGPRCTPCFCLQTRRAYKVSLGRASYRPRSPPPTAILVSGGPASAAVAFLHASHLSSLPPHPTPAHPLLLVHVATSPAAARAAAALADALALPLTVVSGVAAPHLRDAGDASALLRARIRAAAVRAAREHGARVVLLGTTVDRAAVDVLERVVRGCGEGVGEAAKPVVEERGAEGVTFLRPLVNVPVRQALFYLRSVAPALEMDGNDVAAEGGRKAGVRTMRGVLEKFVGVVQAENSSVAHNVVRTAARLDSSSRASACAACGETSGEAAGESAWDMDDSGLADNGDGEAELCFGCRRALAREKRCAVARDSARLAVKEFLLDDSE